MKTRLTFLLLILSTFAGNTYCKNPISKSDKMKPDWLAKELPKPGNFSYFFLKTEGIKPSLDEARNECLSQLAFQVTRSAAFSTSGEMTKHVKSTRSGTGLNEDINSEYVLTYTIDTDTVKVIFRKIDEYWEAIAGDNSSVIYWCHTLYAITKNPTAVAFDQVTFSYKYGGDALWRSALVPGFGQIYKGHKAKGITIMSGEAALIGGIIFCETRRADFKRKSKETFNIDKITNYLDNADNYATCRNICIGAAAALYVYNLIDAVVTDGRKKTSVRPGSIYMAPSLAHDLRGVSLTMNF